MTYDNVEGRPDYFLAFRGEKVDVLAPRSADCLLSVPQHYSMSQSFYLNKQNV
jgi:hypothetical protein